MPRETLVPDRATLEKYVAKGLSQAVIVDAWEKDSGIRVSRSAIGMAMLRHGVDASRRRPRYEELVPWGINPEHNMAYDVRMLRLESRRRLGESIDQTDLKKLTSWLDRLQEQNAVVMYEPRTIQGFWWVPREEGDDDIIRRPAGPAGSAKHRVAGPRPD